jgi:hypothetical protein
VTRAKAGDRRSNLITFTLSVDILEKEIVALLDALMLLYIGRVGGSAHYASCLGFPDESIAYRLLQFLNVRTRQRINAVGDGVSL